MSQGVSRILSFLGVASVVTAVACLGAAEYHETSAQDTDRTDFGYRVGFKQYFGEFQSRILRINERGTCFLVSSYSGTDDFRGEIGWYRGRPDRRLLGKVKEHISGKTFLAGPEIVYDHSMGDPAFDFSFAIGENVNKKYEFGARSTLPPAFLVLKDLYAPLIGELKKHPWKVLRIDIDPGEHGVRAGGYASLSITFTNAGTERIRFANPFAPLGGVMVFVLECQRRNVPPREFSENDFFTIDLKSAGARSPGGEVASSEPRLLELAPGSEIKRRCRFRVPKCPPGEYDVCLVLLSRGSREDLENQSYLDGELRTPARPLVIRKR